jgi:hypothetical protein
LADGRGYLLARWRRKRSTVSHFHVAATAAGALSMGFTDIDPLDELERHLTGDLAVLLREPR